MILKGNQRANGQELARHLLNVDDNEHAIVHELRGFLADDLFGAFQETEAISLGTKCNQYLFSLSLSPPESAKVSIKDFETAIGDIERRLGLCGQSRAIVFHEKKGRRHAHCVWSRIDPAKMRAINLPHFKLRLTDISRELYIEHGWDMPAGLRNHDDRSPSNFSDVEASQAKRAKRDPSALKDLFKTCWTTSDSRAGFEAALLEHGFHLARGDRRGFVAVDADVQIHSISRWCGVKSKELRQRLGDPAELPTVEEAINSFTDNNTQNQAPADHETEKQSAHRLAEHAAKLSELVSRHRQERSTLEAAQEQRRLAEIARRHSSMPVGLKAAWARLTGQYQRLCQELAEDARICSLQARDEMQTMIDKHLSERRVLDRAMAFDAAQDAMAQELHARSNAQNKPEYGLDPRQPLVLPQEDVPFTRQQLLRHPELILEHISDKKARFGRTDILRALAKFVDDPLDLRVASDRVLMCSDLVQIGDGEEEKFTTRQFRAIEEQLLNYTAEMSDLGGFKVGNHIIENAIKRENTSLQSRIGASLSDEQIDAIHHILAPNQLSSVVGLAGVGKSTLLSVAREAWEKQGLRVHGAALAGKAADSLQTASGIPSRTLASIEASWKSGYEPIGCGDVVVIDEAGMVGTRQLTRVAKELQRRGCKLVVVGDPDQLQPIQAGTPFRDIVEKNGAARLIEIRRQTSDWQRKASRQLANGQTEEALLLYADQGALHEGSDREQAIAALVEDYIADWQNNGSAISRLALAHRRKDVHAINQAIKSARMVSGETPVETLFDTDHGPRAFAPGDRILFTRNDRDMRVRNGMLGTVQAIDGDKLIVEFDTVDTGIRRRLTFSPKTFPSIDHGFAVSIHRSQGCTVDRSFVLSSRTLDQNLTYVALTRHKEKTDFYTAPEISPTRRVMNFGTESEREFQRRAPSRTR